MSTHVVATKYRLLEAVSLKENKYNVNGSKENLGTKIVPRQYVEDRNSQVNNELYIIDEDATVEMLKKREQSIIENNAKAEKEKVSNADIVTALVNKISGNKEVEKPKKVEKEAKKEVESNDEYAKYSTDDLKKQLESKGIEYHHKAGRSKLIELLTNNK